jgi:hypothetical protein
LTATGLLLWPSCASAHLITTGTGPVYDGIGRLVMTHEDLIPVLALPPKHFKGKVIQTALTADEEFELRAAFEKT